MSVNQSAPGNFGVEVIGADIFGMSDEVLRLLLLVD